MKTRFILFFLFLFVLGTKLSAQTAVAPSGNGTSESPYLIETLNNLYWLRSSSGELDKHYRQSADIDASTTASWDDDEGYSPIGNFSGVYDGDGYSISGLFLNRSGSNITGMFSSTTNEAEIKNLTLLNVDFTRGDAPMGALVGINFGSITSCGATGSVTGGERTGGLVGHNFGSIDSSYSTVNVYGIAKVGGVAGVNHGEGEEDEEYEEYEEGVISNSYAMGNVTGIEVSIGGLVGENYGEISSSSATGNISIDTEEEYDEDRESIGGLVGMNTGEISESYATGNVLIEEEETGEVGGLVGSNGGDISFSYAMGNISGEFRVGGLAGSSYGDINNSHASGNASGLSLVGGFIGDVITGEVTDSYSTGTATGSENVGGFFGGVQFEIEEIDEPVVTNTYWNTTTSELNDAVGYGSSTGITGLTSTEMQQEASFTGFDFADIWEIEEGLFSFPYLQDVEYSALPGAADENIPGRSLAFNNGTLDVDDDDVFDDLSTLTVEFWAYFNTTGRQGVIEKHESPSSGWWIDFNTDITTVFVTAGGLRVASSTINPGLNMWHHIAISYNGTDIKVYINGEDVTGANTGDGSGAILNNTRSVHIGNLNWFTSYYLNGKMDEIRIWNTVRTTDQIQQNMFQKLTGDESGLIMYLPLDEAFGTSVTDKSPTANTGTLDNVVSWSTDTHPYGTVISGNEGWRLLSSPVGSTSYGTLLDSLWTQGFTGADYESGTSNVYTWNEEAQQFSSIANASDVPAAGTGFLVYVFDDQDYDSSPEGFPKPIMIDANQNEGSISPTLNYSNEGIADSIGWNLVGNPYGSTIEWGAGSGWTRTDVDESFYVWNADAEEYQSHNGSSGTLENDLIAPMQGFWVKANGDDPDLSFSDDIRSGGGILRKKAPVPEIGFELTGSTMSSKTILMFDDRGSLGKDELDAYKLQSLNSTYLSLFTNGENGTSFDINVLPTSFEQPVSTNLNIDGSDLGGQYNLSWSSKTLPEGLSAELIDHQTGSKLSLIETDSYDFEITASTSTAKVATTTREEIKTPTFAVFSPKMIKAKTTESRFTIEIKSKTSVANELESELPTTAGLDQNYPNPFNPSTIISYQLPENSKVQLQVFDMLGRKVAELINGQVVAGYHQVTFDARNLASGMYIYRLQTGNTVITKKLTLIK